MRVREFFYQLLRVDAIRLAITAVRYFYFVGVSRRLRTLDPATGDIGVNAVHHNVLGLKNLRGLAVNRSNLLLYPLAAIRHGKNEPMLCIGPRSEGELLNCLGLGFRNARGMDLISYSPWVDLGDMHAMPYEDNRFAAVTIGWVLAYSNNRQQAAKEAVRVTRNGGLIAVGSEYRSATAEELSARVGYEVCDDERLGSTDEILQCFGDHVDRVFFRQDLPNTPQEKWDLLVVFSIKK